MVDRYYRGQGRVYFAEKDTATGNATGFRWLGNVPELRLSLNTERVEHKESYTGQSQTDKVIEVSQEGTWTMQLEDFSKENLALAMYGQAAAVAAKTVTAEPIVGYIEKSTFLPDINITTFTSLTNTGGLTTYVAGTDYTINLKSGRIDILAGGAITEGQALEANYGAGDFESVGAFTQANTEVWMLFEGLNTAETNNAVVVDAFKVRFNPFTDWDLIGDEFANLSLEGMLLYDPTQDDGSGSGGFFKERQLALA